MWKKSVPSELPKSEELDHVLLPLGLIPGEYTRPSQFHRPARDDPRSSKKPSPKSPSVPLDPDDALFQARHTPAHGRGLFVVEPEGLDHPVGDPDVPQLAEEEPLEVFPFALPIPGNNGLIGLPASILAIALALAFLVPV